ncbi:DNA adenine methylase [Lysinibacillus sphaericus]|uniref:DNA adenine methylase n=1 Tax=Lysinibacillus sphaericus TaxID=1421 RepID=UPI003D7FB148
MGWAGGKKQSLPTLQAHSPEDLKAREITRYIEPFLGGGTVMFDILQNYATVKEVYINDN